MCSALAFLWDEYATFSVRRLVRRASNNWMMIE